MGRPGRNPGAFYSGPTQGEVECLRRLLRDQSPSTVRRTEMQQRVVAAIEASGNALLLSTKSQSPAKSLALTPSGILGAAAFASGGYSIFSPTFGSHFEFSQSRGVRDMQIFVERGMVASMDLNDRLWVEDLQFGGGRRKISTSFDLDQGSEGKLSESGDEQHLLVSWGSLSSDSVTLMNLADLTQGPKPLRISPVHSRDRDRDNVINAILSPSTKTSLLVGALWDGRIEIYPLQAQNSTPFEIVPKGTKQKSAAFKLVFSPQGSHLAAGKVNGSILLWRLSRGMNSEVQIAPAKNPIQLRTKKLVSQLFFDHDGSKLVAASNDGAPELWLTAEQTRLFEIEIPTIRGSKPQILGGAFSSESTKIWMYSATHLFVFDAHTGQLLNHYRRTVAQSKFASFDASDRAGVLALGMSDGDILMLRSDHPPDALP